MFNEIVSPFFQIYRLLLVLTIFSFNSKLIIAFSVIKNILTMSETLIVVKHISVFFNMKFIYYTRGEYKRNDILRYLLLQLWYNCNKNVDSDIYGLRFIQASH